LLLLEKEKKPEGKRHSASELRKAAEKKLTRLPGTPPDMNEKGSEELLHELQVHQIELEMQNEELRKAQLTLEESRQRYVELYNFSPVGYFTFTQEALIKEVNLTGATLLGVARQKLINVRFRRMVASKDQDQWDQHFLSVLRKEAKQTCDLMIKRQDGSTFSAGLESIRKEVSRGVFEVHTTITDVTERKQTQREQERYRTFLEGINDICFENDLKGNVTFFNDAMCRILDLGPEELQYMNFRQFATEDTTEKMFKIYNEISRTDKPAQFNNFEIIRKDGIGRFLDIMVSLIRDAEGSPIGFRGVARDVTERKRMEEEQEGLREQINQVRKLESIGTLAGGIAHDFNNLLMGIQGYASLMLMDIDSQHPNYKPLKAIESQVRSGADLTKQLLGYARHGRYEVKSTDLNELLTKTASMFSRTNKGIHIYPNYEKLLWKTEVDQGQIDQVFLDLFLNAAQAMPGGGSLYLETENTILDENYIKPFKIMPGSYVKISVTDTGIGMDKETMRQIFDPFFTTKEMTRGAGLGLAAAYGIIKGHKGIINVYSEKGYGTTFNIYLPARHQEEIHQEEPAIGTVKKQITLLFVDDEKAITEVTSTMLEKLGHRVIIAHGGKDAVVMYRMNRDRIDLVIMDMIMPDMSGGEAIEKIRSINPEVKVILSSGYSLNGMAREIMDRGGVQAFLQKPFQLEKLAAKINEVLEN